jgi:hypothetical protein
VATRFYDEEEEHMPTNCWENTPYALSWCGCCCFLLFFLFLICLGITTDGSRIEVRGGVCTLATCFPTRHSACDTYEFKELHYGAEIKAKGTVPGRFCTKNLTNTSAQYEVVSSGLCADPLNYGQCEDAAAALGKKFEGYSEPGLGVPYGCWTSGNLTYWAITSGEASGRTLGSVENPDKGSAPSLPNTALPAARKKSAAVALKKHARNSILHDTDHEASKHEIGPRGLFTVSSGSSTDQYDDQDFCDCTLSDECTDTLLQFTPPAGMTPGAW